MSLYHDLRELHAAANLPPHTHGFAVRDASECASCRYKHESAEKLNQLLHASLTELLTSLAFLDGLFTTPEGEARLTVNILRAGWTREKLERFALHLLGDEWSQVKGCQLHSQMLEVMNHQNLEWTEEYAKLELENADLKERLRALTPLTPL